MDWDALFNYLGAGGGLIVLLNWVAGLPLLRRKNHLEKDDVSRLMAEKDNETILKLYDEIRNFQARMSRLEGCIAKIVVCPVYDRCPARTLVQEYKRRYFPPGGRQPSVGQKGERRPRDRTASGDSSDGPDGQPPSAPFRSDLYK